MNFPIKVIVPWLPGKRDGIATPWFIFIKKDHANNVVLWRHEMVHIAQFKRIGYLKYMWRYLTDLQFRIEVESEAYGPGVSRSWIRKQYRRPF